MQTRTLALSLFIAVTYGAGSSPVLGQDYDRYPTTVSAGYPESPEAFQQYGYKYYQKYLESHQDQPPKDSFRYYGPNGLWWQWNPSQQRGRDMWMFWTAGNQKFYRRLQLLTDKLPVDVSVDFFRLLDTRNRGHRFRDLGLINEPNFSQADEPDEYGLWLDRWDGDPLDYYPNSYYQDEHDLKKYWGEPTGILGTRKFKNPRFTPELEAKWKEDPQAALGKYFANPGSVEPPYLVGITCAFCHIAFNPLNPPDDPENPRWENLAANIGNQYFDEGGLFFGRGRLGGGNQRPADGYFVDDDPKKGVDDPYRTRGFGPQDFIWHYGATQQRGTSETSRFSYDFINNPNTINKIFNVAGRVQFWETAPNGVTQPTLHVLKDGADSVGVPMALQRVYVNIGAESKYWTDHLFNPLTGRQQRPLVVDEVRLAVSDKEQEELQKKYHDEIYGEPFGLDWKYTEARISDMINYLVTYTPFYLKDAQGYKPEYVQDDRARRGARVFADTCAECHSSKQPPYYVKPEQRQAWFRQAVGKDDFLLGNALSSGVRYPVTHLGINSQRAMATNAIDGDIWAEFSSNDYKALPPVGKIQLTIPLTQTERIEIEYTPPGGGRGYYRPASLVSLWATAPFLHNNSIGREPLKRAAAADITEENPYLVSEGDVITDAQAITVEGRLELFNDACEKLLWPEKRSHYIKRTSAPSGISVPFDAVKQNLIRAGANIAADVILDRARTQLMEAEVGAEEAGKIVTALRPTVVDGIVKLLESLEDPQKAEGVVNLIEQLLATTGKDHQVPVATIHKVVQHVKPYARQVLEQLNTKVPAGTPVNLFLNQKIDALPYIAAALVQYQKNPRKLAETLLMLSECPDIVEDRGHYFGTQWDPRGRSYALDDDQKRDLIEFLKTL